MHLNAFYVIGGQLGSILGVFSLFRAICRMKNGMGLDGYHRMVVIDQRCFKSTFGANKESLR